MDSHDNVLDKAYFRPAQREFYFFADITDNVKPHLEKILKSRNATLQQVFGVQQEGNQATVYYLAEGPSIFGVPGSGGPGSKSPAVGGPGADKRGLLREQLRLVRFNSGEWFDPQHQSFVVK